MINSKSNLYFKLVLSAVFAFAWSEEILFGLAQAKAGAPADWKLSSKTEKPQASTVPGKESLSIKLLSNPVDSSAPSTQSVASENELAPAASGAAVKGNTDLDGANNPSTVPEIAKKCEAITSGPVFPYTEAANETIITSCKPLASTDETCMAVFSQTNRWCHTEKNESITESVTLIQGLMSAASGITNACDNFGKAMDIAKKAMSLYTTACSAAQVACNMKCGTALKALTSAKEGFTRAKILVNSNCKIAISDAITFGDPITSPAKIAEIEKNCASYLASLSPIAAAVEAELSPQGNLPSVASKVQICKVSVMALLGTAAINLGALAQSKNQSDQCKADTEAKKAAEQACTNPANKDRQDCKPKSDIVDCGKSENTDKPICICKANPRMKGCEGVSTSLATNSTLGSGSGGGLGSNRNPSGKIIAAPGTAAEGKGFPNDKNGKGTDGNNSGSAGGGGSSAGLSGMSGDSGSSKGAVDETASKDSANILDSGGGGGGGGFRSGGFSGYSSPSYRNKLKAFAAKNGIGAKIAGNGWTEQVTGTGGKSNFDKVKARYQENKSTLLNGK